MLTNPDETISADDLPPSAADWGRSGVSAGGLRVAKAAAEAYLCEPDGAGGVRAPSAQWVRQIVEQYDLSIGHASLTVRLGMKVILTLVEWLPVVFLRRWSRFTRLPLAERLAYLERFEAHPHGLVASVSYALKVPLLIPAFEEGEALAMTGFDRESIVSARRLVDGPSAGRESDDGAAQAPEDPPT